MVRDLVEGYDHPVLTGGFSKAYSSLLAFIACPPPIKRLLKITAPPYLYSGPSPVASLANTLLGLQVNASRGDELRATLLGGWRRVGRAVAVTAGTRVGFKGSGTRLRHRGCQRSRSLPFPDQMEALVVVDRMA